RRAAEQRIISVGGSAVRPGRASGRLLCNQSAWSCCMSLCRRQPRLPGCAIQTLRVSKLCRGGGARTDSLILELGARVVLSRSVDGGEWLSLIVANLLPALRLFLQDV